MEIFVVAPKRDRDRKYIHTYNLFLSNTVSKSGTVA